jgi:hypothetical protein
MHQEESSDEVSDLTGMANGIRNAILGCFKGNVQDQHNCLPGLQLLTFGTDDSAQSRCG